MKLLIVMFLFMSTISVASENQNKNINKNVHEQMEKEKKYAEEQKFYFADEYDFEGAQVDEKSLDSIPEQPDYNDDFNMDSVYGM